jgi:autotransporter-associated beta strand protein
MTGNMTYTGATTISAGTLSIGNGGTTGSIAGAITNNAALVFNRSDGTVASPVTHAGAISGTGTVTKNGGGVLALTNSNTYGGGTTVSAGTLLANNSSGSATGSGGITVASGATLGGTGAVSGAVNVAAGGTLSPGASIESLETGTLTFSATASIASALKFEIGTGGQADLVNARLGDLNIADATAAGSAAGTNLDLSTTGYIPTGNKYTVVIYDENWNLKKFKNDINGYVYLSAGPNSRQFLIKYNDQNYGSNFSGESAAALSANSNTRFVTLTAVPELGSFLSMGLVGCCAIGATWLGKRFKLKVLSL